MSNGPQERPVEPNAMQRVSAVGMEVHNHLVQKYPELSAFEAMASLLLIIEVMGLETKMTPKMLLKGFEAAMTDYRKKYIARHRNG